MIYTMKTVKVSTTAISTTQLTMAMKTQDSTQLLEYLAFGYVMPTATKIIKTLIKTTKTKIAFFKEISTNHLRLVIAAM